MPARSKKQWRWMFATDQPFARRWSHMKPYASLPAAKEEAAMAHGPGGLLATPGLGGRTKKWGKRFKAKQIAGNLYRGDDGKFQAGGAGGSSTSAPAKGRTPKRGDTLPEVKPLKPAKGGRGRAPAKPKQPAKTPEQRQQEQQAKREAATAEQRATRDKLLTEAGIDANTQGALVDARDGNTLTPANGAKLASMGLAEQAADGSYRLTPAGIGAVDSAMRGDAGRLQTTLSKARDTASKQPKVAEPKKGGGSGGSAKPEKEKPDKDAISAQKKAENRSAVKQQMMDSDTGLGPAGFDAFTAFADGGPLDPAHAKGLADMGLVEGNPPRLSSAGRAAQNAIDRGDYRDAVDAIGRGQQRAGDAAQRTADQQARQATAEGQRAAQEAAKRQQLERLRKRAQAGAKLTQSERDRLTDAGLAEEDGLTWRPKSFAVFKDHQGDYRWIARTTTAYRDRDGEIISIKALEDDAARMTATGQYGPLRYWHVGDPEPLDDAAPWGPGLDIGDCDFSIVIGRTSIESGTFKNAAIGRAYAEHADDYELSPGFFHPEIQPIDGVFTNIRRFERSTVPVAYGRASNLFTGLTVKEHRMDQATYNARVKTFLEDMNAKGVPPEVAGAVVVQERQAEKSAQSQGIAFKSTDALPVYTAPDGTQGIIQDGLFVALKAAPPMVEEAAVVEEAKADPMAEEIIEPIVDEPIVDEDMGPEVIGNMTWDEFAAKLAETLAPVLKMQDMVKSITEMGGELKSMYGGVAQKDASRAEELATLKSEQAKLNARIAQIEGQQPATILPTEVEAAFKSSGPTNPPEANPNTPIVPNDPNRPLAALGAATAPWLYTENGWQQLPAN